MSWTKAHEAAALGQSLWYDNIRRALLDSGELKRLIDDGVLGVTSNPTIFEKAIGGSTDYDVALEALVNGGSSIEAIYESLVVDDIRRAADVLAPTYEQTNGVDGYISLEVSPTLAHDTQGTVEEARRLFADVGRPNVMIKVPATPEGIPAIQMLISEGININVTLIFALQSYRAVMEAYLNGLEALADTGVDVSRVASVASFFVSRVDTLVDAELAKRGVGSELHGRIAIANAKLAYALFRETFSGERWERLAARGARVQRPLWASTGTKNPAYPDTYYVDALIGRDTVNTIPPATLTAFLDHGTVAETITVGLDEARSQMERLASYGVSMYEVTEQLLSEGVTAFAKSFETLMRSITDKRDKLVSILQRREAYLGNYKPVIEAALVGMEERNISSRMWVKDHTVWNPDPTEIANRLGWLTIAERMAEPENLLKLQGLVEAVRGDGLTHALLLGMGGSSLAPEVFRKTFGVAGGHLDLAVLDSTDPDAVLSRLHASDPMRTLYIVSTKSGGTVETFSFLKFFYNRVLELHGGDKRRAGQHFVAITDPGSGLETAARENQFRAVFLNDATIGGRYSALSLFGLVPAALVGVDVMKLLARTAETVAWCSAAVSAPDNPAMWLGAIMGELAKVGRDKVTLVTSPGLESFGDWVEQLIAESTGKLGKGILPVVGEPVGEPSQYGADRLFVYLKLQGDHTQDAAVKRLEEAGHPVVFFQLRDAYDLGGQYFLWELATAVAGYILGINPFDQPNVESAKVLARQMVTAYTQTGSLPPQTPALIDGAISVYGTVNGATGAADALRTFLSSASAGDYVSLHAYIAPTPEADAALATLRNLIRERTRLATTVGYGPRFLHSTGQLHKGDAGNGLFIQFTSDPAHDAAIPDEIGSTASAMTFGVLKMAQALGDGQALIDNGRRLLRFHLGRDIVIGLHRLLDGLK